MAISTFVARYTVCKMASTGDIVMLNVGGRVYATSRATLSKDSSSMLARMFTNENSASTDRNGNFVIDRDGDTFKYILNFLRDGSCVLPVTYQLRAELLREAEYYQVNSSARRLKLHACNGDDAPLLA